MNKLKIVNCVLIFSLAYDYRVARRNRAKFEKLREEKEILLKQIGHSLAVTAYLSHKLDENEIEIDEFDLIALNNLM